MGNRLDQQFLSFALGNENYALPVAIVREVLEYDRISKIPTSVSYFKGIIDVRGKGIPVLDLGKRLGLDESISDDNKAIIIVDKKLKTGNQLPIGLLADSVHEVIRIHDEDVDLAPSIGNEIVLSFISGVARMGDGFIFIMNLDKLLSEIEDPVYGQEEDSIINSEE